MMLWRSVLLCLLALVFSAGNRLHADERTVLRLFPSAQGCITLLTNALHGLYAGCPPRERMRRLSGMPEAYPVDLARNAAGWWLLTQRGLYHAPAKQAPWQRLEKLGGLTLDCSSQVCLWAPRAGGVHRVLSDHGMTPWEEGLPSAPVHALTHDRKLGWLVAIYGEGVFRRSADHAAWEPDSAGLRSRNLVTIDCDNQGNCLLGTVGGGLYRRLAEEPRWQRLTLPGVRQVTAVATGLTLWLAATDDGLLASTDQGEHWDDISPDAAVTVSSLGISDGGRYWVGGAQGRLYHGKGVASPDLVHVPGEYRVQGLAAQDGQVFMLMRNQLFRATGTGWQSIDWPDGLHEAVGGLAVDADGGVLVGGEAGGPMRLSPGDDRWLAHHRGLPEGARVRQLLTAADGTVYLTTRGAVEQQLFALAPGEKSWQAVVPGGKGAPEPYRVRWLDHIVGGTVVAWGFYDVLWKRPGETDWHQSWFSRTPNEPPTIDAQDRLWIKRESVYSFNRPGELVWHKGSPPSERWGSAASVAPDSWVAAGQAELVLLQKPDGAMWKPVSRLPLPSEGALWLITGASGRIFVGGEDGIYQTDLDSGVWTDITPMLHPSGARP